MSEWVIPVESETGIPLSFATRFDIPEKLRSVEREHDWHHAIYPKKTYTSLSGMALRGARVQYVDYDEHRTYHYYFDEYFAEQWKAPDSQLDRLGMVVLLTAGYVPPVAIRSRRQGPEYVNLSERKRRLMWDRGLVRVENEYQVLRFLQTMVLDTEFDIDDTAVQEFVFSKNEVVQLQRGTELLNQAAERITDPIRSQYRNAYLGRLIRPDLPSEPHECVLASPLMLGTEKRLRKTRTALRKDLAKSMGVKLPDAA